MGSIGYMLKRIYKRWQNRRWRKAKGRGQGDTAFLIKEFQQWKASEKLVC
jgi:hypothetical protein